MAARKKLQPFKNVERALAPKGKQLRTDAETSKRLGKIRQKSTKPEIIVRKMLHAMGHRYRSGNRDLPGSPDIANRSKKWAVFVHGCYWHSHQGCPKATVPKNNREFWVAKFEKNRQRDERVQGELREMGYRVVVIWECETKDHTTIEARLEELESARLLLPAQMRSFLAGITGIRDPGPVLAFVDLFR